MNFVTSSTDETFALGKKLGEVLESGDFVGLSGQLGAGKTQFSRGVADGAGVPLDDVSSPTYSIVQSYRGSKFALHHADLYRLTGEGDLFATGFFDLLESDGAMLVEWIEQVKSAAPDDALLISISVTGETTRTIEVKTSGPKSAALLTRWIAGTKSEAG